MLFDFNKNNYKFREEFDEFPNIEKHNFRFTKCTCGSTKSYVVSTVSRHRNFLPIVACSTCGTLRANPYFADETAAHYYANIYGKVKREGVAPEDLFAKQKKATLVPLMSGLMDAFSSVLDYGGGAGGRTAGFLEHGKSVALYEVEGEYSNHALSQGIQAYDDNKTYDFVVVSHVIEHMTDPVTQMADVIKKCCSENGLLLVATPIIDRERARRWLQHFHIAHKYYFTHDALLGVMSGLGCKLVKHNNADAYLFRVGNDPDPEYASACFAKGAEKTKSLVEAELKPSIGKLWRELKSWKPIAHDQH